MSNSATPADRFAEQVLPFARELRSTALRLTGTPVDADDLVQETYAKAYAGFASFKPGTNLGAWLYRIEKNAFYGAYRARRCRPREVSLESVEQAGPRVTAVSSAEDVALARLPDPAVTEALRGLPGQMAVTVYLADALNYRYAEIARMTRVPLGTVMSRLHRGRKRLRATLASDSRSARADQPRAA